MWISVVCPGQKIWQMCATLHFWQTECNCQDLLNFIFAFGKKEHDRYDENGTVKAGPAVLELSNSRATLQSNCTCRFRTPLASADSAITGKQHYNRTWAQDELQHMMWRRTAPQPNIIKTPKCPSPWLKFMPFSWHCQKTFELPK